MAPHNLPKDIEKLLKRQAKIDEKTDKLISYFLIEHDQTEIYGLVDFIFSLKIQKHIDAINEFKLNYEKNTLSLKHIKVYLDLLDLHKDKMKKPKNNMAKSVVEEKE